MNLKKKPEEGNEDQKMAKMKALKELRGAMSETKDGGLDGMMKMKKVTVAAPDAKDLKMGLDKAKDLVDKMPNDSGSKMNPDEEDSDEGNDYEKENEPIEGSADEEKEEESEMDEAIEALDSPEEIDAMMKKLEAKKASLKK